MIKLILMKLIFALYLGHFLSFIILFQSSFAQKNIDLFLKNLYNQSQEYQQVRENEYNQFCKELNVQKNNELNQENFFFIYFLHDLFTNSSAQNCNVEGILEIPYFWHWINPNPRNEILYLPDSVKLNMKKPPKQLSRYKSFADIDRTPYLFLSDLVSVQPKYYHEDCSDFYTFGWCSEKEMSFNSILSVLNYPCKIKQSGIHTRSEIWVKMLDINNKNVNVILKVDNTFDIVEWNLADNNVTFEQWKLDVGQGSDIKWYNNKSHSADEISRVKSIIVPAQSAIRIKKLVDEWIK